MSSRMAVGKLALVLALALSGCSDAGDTGGNEGSDDGMPAPPESFGTVWLTFKGEDYVLSATNARYARGFSSVVVFGQPTTASDLESVLLQFPNKPGSYDCHLDQYSDITIRTEADEYFPSDPCEIIVTQFGEVGETISGTFSSQTYLGGHVFEGRFEVTRGEDQ